MALFSKQNKEVFTNPLNVDHPILGQVLGICSALAVTSQLKPAIVMGLAVTVITAFSNTIISIIRNTIPNRIRIVVQLVVVAALVTIVSQILKAFAYDVSVQLSVYVGLIITNCILMGRLEAFAMQNKPWPSFLDGVGNGLGYAMILVIVGAVRELLGRGSLLGFQIIPDACYDFGYVNNGMMTMPVQARCLRLSSLCLIRLALIQKALCTITSEANLRLSPQKSENPKVFALLFCTFITFSYLCNRVHAVLALRGSEGVGQTYWIQRLTTLCFWLFEPRKFKPS